MEALRFRGALVEENQNWLVVFTFVRYLKIYGHVAVNALRVSFGGITEHISTKNELKAMGIKEIDAELHHL